LDKPRTDKEVPIQAAPPSRAKLGGYTSKGKFRTRDTFLLEPQMHISKEGDPYLRTPLVLGRSTFWARSAWTAICETGRAWWEERETSYRGYGEKAGGVAASSVGERSSVRTVAQQQQNDSARSRAKKNRSRRRTDKSPSRVPVTASNAWPNFHLRSKRRSTIRWQHRLKRERPTCTERTKSLTYLHSCSLPLSADAAFFAAYRRNCLGQACTFCPPSALVPKKSFLTLL
jgi:hypothetical protein